MSERFPDCYRMLVQGVEVDCLLGVYEHEQREARRIGVEVELFVPISDPNGQRAVAEVPQPVGCR